MTNSTMFIPSFSMSPHIFNMNLVERIDNYTAKKWITKRQRRQMMVEMEKDPEAVMSALDAIEQDRFWKNNSVDNVWSVWFSLFLIWSNIAYQSVSFYCGVIWDSNYVTSFLLMLAGFCIMYDTTPICYD